jgi:hypothetical protein
VVAAFLDASQMQMFAQQVEKSSANVQDDLLIRTIDREVDRQTRYASLFAILIPLVEACGQICRTSVVPEKSRVVPSDVCQLLGKRTRPSGLIGVRCRFRTCDPQLVRTNKHSESSTDLAPFEIDTLTGARASGALHTIEW